MEKLKSIKFLMILYFTTIITIGMVFVAVIFYEKFKSTAQDYAIKSVDQLIMQSQIYFRQLYQKYDGRF